MRWVTSAFMILVLVGCQTIRPEKTKPEKDLINRTITSIKSFWIERLDLDYEADCRIRLKMPKLDENGSCRIIITRDSLLRLTVRSPVAGTILTIYQDRNQIQLLNYHDKTALQLSNSSRNRSKVLETMNFNGAEFRSIFWGREISSDRTDLLFSYKNERPVQIRKRADRSGRLVTIRKWLTYNGIEFPRIISFDDDSRKAHLKVVITRFRPGLSGHVEPLDIPDNFTILR